MGKIPYFRFFPGDWLSSSKVQLMDDAERGIYIMLLAAAWNFPDCTLPADIETCRRLARSKRRSKVEKVLRTCWELTENGWRNDRELIENAYATEKHTKAVLSAKARYVKETIPANAMRTQCERNANQNQNQNQNQKKREAGKIENPARNPEAIASEKAEEALRQVAAQVEGYRTGARLAITDPIAVAVILKDLGGKDPALKLPPEDFRVLFLQHYVRRELTAFAASRDENKKTRSPDTS